MIIIRDEKKPLVCDECWAFDNVIVRNKPLGICLITNKLLTDYIYNNECPLEEVPDE